MKRATTSAEAPVGEGERVSEQANQLHNPPVMFNEREITFYTFLHSCDKHAVFFCVCGSHWDFNHNRVMWLWW